MLAPRDTQTRQRKSLDGLWRSARPGRRRPRRELVAGATAQAREIPVPSSYNDIFPEAECTTTSAMLGMRPSFASRRDGPRADRAAVRLRDPPCGGLGQRHSGGRARGRLTPFEADVTDSSTWRREPGHGRRQQRPEMASIPPVTWSTPRTGPGSTFPRLLQLRGAAPYRSAVLDAALLRRRHLRCHRARRSEGTVSYDVDAVDAQDLTVKVTLRTRKAPRSPSRRATLARSRSPTCARGARVRATCTSSRSNSGGTAPGR